MNKKILFFFCAMLFLLIDISTSYAGEDSTYDFAWLDPDKKVYVLQNRKFFKNRKIHVSLGGGITTSGAFVDSNNIQGRVGYFFSEDWGFEGVFSKNSGKENVTAESVRQSGTIPFRRVVDDYMGGMILWSPFYGKVNTFGAIVYFDWILGLGYGKLNEHNNKEAVVNRINETDKNESHSGIMWTTGLKFYLSQSWYVRFDVTTMHYKALSPAAITTGGKQKYYSNYDLALSLGANF